jgi:ribosomal protein L31
MSFYNPAFLWALFLLAVPLIIHLFNFRRYKKVVFSNVQLLKEIQTESKKSRQLKKWLILALRMLAIAALVIAFAKPYIPLKNQVAGKSLVSIYLDNSESMLNNSTDGPLFEVAKNRAREIINGLPSDAEIQVIDNEFSPVSNKTFSKETALAVVDNIELSQASNHIAKAVQKAQTKKIGEGYASQTIFALTDLQKNESNQQTELDSTTQLKVVKLQPEAVENISVDTVYLTEPISRVGEPIQLKVKISNRGASEASSSLILSVNGVQQGAESFTLSKQETTELELSFIPTKPGWLQGKLVINDYPITFDNTYFFSFFIKEQLGVLHIGEQQQGIEKIFRRDNAFSYVYKSQGEIDFSSLRRYDLIILNQPDGISSGLTEQLKQFMQSGGAVLVIPKASISYEAFTAAVSSSTWGTEQVKNLTISAPSLEHPFYAGVYKSIPKNTVLPKVNKLRRINPGYSILQLKDGSTVLGYQRVGSGVLYQLAMPLNEAYSNLAKTELWVVTLLKLAFTKTQKQALAYNLTSTDPILLAAETTGENVLELKNDKAAYVVASSLVNGQLKLWLNSEIDQPGNYTLVDNRDSVYGTIALNALRTESNQEFATLDELKTQISGEVEMIDGSTAGIKDAVSNMANGKPLWKLFILACLVFLLVEVLLLRFYKV